MSHTYLLNALDADRWQLLRDTTHQLDVGMRRSSVVIPGRPGEIATGRDAEAPTMALILAPRGADLDRQLDDVSTLLTAPTLTCTRVADGVSRVADVELVGHVWHPDRMLRHRRAVATVTLSIPGVWWRDPATMDVSLAAGAQTILPAGTPPVDRVGSAPVTDAIVRFALQAAAPSITDTLTGTGVSVANNATATQYTYLDAGRLQAWVSTSASAWTAPGSGRLDHLVDYPGPGPLAITPQLRLGATGTDDQRWAARARVADVVASHAVVLRYRRSWW